MLIKRVEAKWPSKGRGVSLKSFKVGEDAHKKKFIFVVEPLRYGYPPHPWTLVVHKLNKLYYYGFDIHILTENIFN